MKTYGKWEKGRRFSFQYLGNVEQFGRNGCWYKCRELFHQSLIRQSFLYVEQPKNLDVIVAFIQKIENKVTPKNQRLKFYHTNRNNTMHVQLSDWWQVPFRLTLLTILIRKGKRYSPTKNNWRKTIAKGKYSGKTSLLAIRRFVKGYTHLTTRWGYFDNWVKYFKGKNKFKNLVKT